jgi:hypothetical protein
MTGGVDFIYGSGVGEVIKLKSWRLVAVSCCGHCAWNENEI